MRGLLGKTLAHSFSKLIHEQIDNKPYDLIETDQLGPFFQDKAFTAVNVTIPYKEAVIEYCDELSQVVQATRACNTIVNRQGTLYAYNTDYHGLKFLLEFNQINIKNKSVAIIGNGSTSRTCQFLSKELQASKVMVFARKPKDKELLLSNIDSYDFDILINATPIGMYPNNDMDLPIEISKHTTLSVVIDLVYNPLQTKLILEAKRHKKKAVNGLIMLVHQAVKANELFNNVSHPSSLTVTIYNNLLKEVLNIVFIGMPMSGKSYISKQIATKYNKSIVDLDKLLELEYGLKIPKIFDLYGETRFRAMENEICRKYSKLSNQAISTGGGIILNKENIEYLQQNGIIIFLDVPLQELVQRNPKDRPLLQNQENIEKLYYERIELYRKYADITVEKRGYKANNTINEIEVKLNEYLSSKWS